MPTLHLGVIDLPYGKPPKARKRKSALKSTTAITTGDVAGFLEAKYHVYEIFYQTKEKQIALALEHSMVGALESLMMGAPASLDPFAGAGDKVTTMLKDFITNRDMERLGYPGVPTKAALKGVNHRLAHPFASGNPRRPSFIDTSQWWASTKAWID